MARRSVARRSVARRSVARRSVARRSGAVTFANGRVKVIRILTKTASRRSKALNDNDDDGMTVGLDGDDRAVEVAVEGIGDLARLPVPTDGTAESAESGASWPFAPPMPPLA